MPYTITLTDGATLTTIPDGHYDNTTSLTLPGKNLSGYGQIQNENFIYLLENFANTSAPAGQLLTGQLWFNKTTNSLNVYNNSNWQPLSVISTNQSVASNFGNFWYDTVNNQLSINTGSGFTVIGPEQVPGYGTTRLISTQLTDINNNNYAVIECLVNNVVVAIISQRAFTLSNAVNPIAGFANISNGITLSATSILSGLSSSATNASLLLSSDQTQYIPASTIAYSNTIVQRDTQGNISINGLATNATNGIIYGSWQADTGISPTVNGGSNLGSSSLQWGSVYAQAVNSTVVTAGTVNVGTVNFSALIDQFSTLVNKFDKDKTLSANSDVNVPTQKAVKNYVDTQISQVSLQQGPTGYTGSVGQPGNTGYTQSLSPNGYTKLPNGMIMQWGTANNLSNPILGNSNYGPFTFYTPFTTACVHVGVSLLLSNGKPAQIAASASAFGTNQFYVATGTGSGANANGYTYFAIGY